MAGRKLGCQAAKMAARTSAKANGSGTDTRPAPTAPAAPTDAPATAEACGPTTNTPNLSAFHACYFHCGALHL